MFFVWQSTILVQREIYQLLDEFKFCAAIQSHKRMTIFLKCRERGKVFSYAVMYPTTSDGLVHISGWIFMVPTGWILITEFILWFFLWCWGGEREWYYLCPWKWYGPARVRRCLPGRCLLADRTCAVSLWRSTKVMLPKRMSGFQKRKEKKETRGERKGRATVCHPVFLKYVHSEISYSVILQ